MVDVRRAHVDVTSRNDDVSRQDDTSIPSRFVRLGFPRMLLPALMFTLIVGIWYAYLTLHCVPLLQLHKPPTRRVQSDVDTGLCHFFLLTISVILLITSYGRAIFVLPGYIPDTPEWAYVASDGGKDVLDVGRSLETKVAGGHRRCRKCVTPKYKPDRAHHCRVCKTCVLRMDHHCPWIYNCVGFYNYKYFFLLLLYSAVSLHIVAWTFWITMVNLLMSQPYGTMEEAVYVALFVETFAIAGSLVFTVFCGYHIWLIVRGMSTIEHMEKYESAPLTSMWSLGVWNNVRAALGANAALWFLPCSPAVGNGLKFESKVKFE